MKNLRATNATRACRAQAGTSMIEMMIAVSLFATVMLSGMAMVESGRRFSRSTMHITHVEDLAQSMLFKMERELASAIVPEVPDTVLTDNLSSGALDAVEVGSTAGFPPYGMLIVERGTPEEERISYSRIEPFVTGYQAAFLDLARGQACTNPTAFVGPGDASDQILWAGVAEVLTNQSSPPASSFDGRAMTPEGPLFFFGDGVGFSYREPIDPTGGNDFLNNGDLRIGAIVPGVGPTETGWKALVFQANDVYDESETGDDINNDGDTVDVFDVGQIRQLAWDYTDPDNSWSVGLGPSNVMQERCNQGGDLDNDGFDDPIFLWDKEQSLLQITLFLLGKSERDQPVVRRVQSAVFIRNEPLL